jgi:hydrogenase maturation factor
LEELSAAGGHLIRVFRDRIPVLAETREICGLLEIDPLGLIASGSLLITCVKERAGEVIQAIRDAGVDVVCIGEVRERGCGIEALSDDNGAPVPWPRFEADEIARVFRQYGQE